jgi:hypothetical protein
MSLMWMPVLITRAPLALARSAAGIGSPAAAKTIAPSSCSGGASSEDPAHSAPRERANSWPAASPDAVGAEEAEDLAGSDREGDVLDAAVAAVELRQPLCLDRRDRHGSRFCRNLRAARTVAV